MEERFITVQRTARYHLLGEAASAKEVWIVLHGYGHLARFFLNTFEGTEGERLIAAPEALSRFYTDNTFTRVGGSWMTREDRDHEITDQIAYLDALAAAVMASCPKAGRLNVLGFSQGVATASRWAFRGNTRIARLVLWGGSMPPELPPAELAARWSTLHVDLVHGERDEVVGEETLVKNQRLLTKAGVAHTTHRFDGGHALEPLLLGRIMDRP